MMPEMSGMDLHRELARLAPAQAERIIFLTGGAFSPAAREFLDTVANPRLEKPVDTANLIALIEGMANREGAPNRDAPPVGRARRRGAG
jgi:FixJ family two-component response regulator